MYSRLDVATAAIKAAADMVLGDRERYRPFLEEGERFASARGLVVSGAAAARLLLAAAPGRDDYHYSFYGGSRADAHRLADALYRLAPDGLAHYTTVLSEPGGPQKIIVDGRVLFEIEGLPTRRGRSLAGALATVEAPARFARAGPAAPPALRCAAPEVVLLGVYAALCCPAAASQWGALLGAESALRALYLRGGAAGGGAAGGAAETTGGGGGGGAAAHYRPDAAGQALARALADRYARGPGRVVVGRAAVALLLGGQAAVGPLHVVAAGGLADEARAAAALAREQGVELDWHEEALHVPGTPELRRLTVYRERGPAREKVLVVYDAGARELVPFVARADTRVGAPFVLLRFALVELWAVRVRALHGAADEERSAARALQADYRAVGAHCTALLAAAGRAGVPAAAATAAAALLPRAYEGRLESAAAARQRRLAEARAAGLHPQAYYPAKAHAAARPEPPRRGSRPGRAPSAGRSRAKKRRP
jgi:hypothetical protein